MKIRLIEDAEFERFFPPLDKNEAYFLEKSIRAEGCRDAIIIWNGVILDGYNRYRICRKYDLPFQVRNMNFSSRDEAISWICDNQLGRRNLTEEVKRYLVGKRYEAEKRIGARNASGNNQYTTANEDSPQIEGRAKEPYSKHGVSVAIGKQYRLSHATVERYGRYAQAVDKLAEVDPSIVPHILGGRVQIGQENIIDLSNLNERQIRAVTATVPPAYDYHLSRERIIAALKQDKNSTSTEIEKLEDEPVESVKKMPTYDPDAEIASLTLTIPSWRTSIERIRSFPDMQNVSSAAKAFLRRELSSLRSTIEDLVSTIEEE